MHRKLGPPSFVSTLLKLEGNGMHNRTNGQMSMIEDYLIRCGWDRNSAFEWMHTPNPQWDNKTPKDLVDEEQEDVIVRFLKKKGINLHAYL